MNRGLLVIFYLLGALGALAGLCDVVQATGLPPDHIAVWSFDEGDGTTVVERVSGRRDVGYGHARLGAGVQGSGWRGDGFTSRVISPVAAVPVLTNAFTMEAWIAPQEYSWNWTGIVDQEQVRKGWVAAGAVLSEGAVPPDEACGAGAGFSLGLNHTGQVGLFAAVGPMRTWTGCLSTVSVPLLKWSHIAGVFDSRTGFQIYVNGELAGHCAVTGELSATRADLWIGMSHRKQVPVGTERRPSARFFSAMVYDGLIDEVVMHRRALTAVEIKHAFAAVKGVPPQPLQYRKMPTGPEGTGRFGAFYARLKYCDEWDRLWRVASHPDVVVQFDDSPVKLIFWRGTGYIPYWAAENGICVADQGVETGDKWGCAEAMSDKQCRYSHVRIIENTPARAVIHWRTASPDITYSAAHPDPDTGWGEWTDEYFYVYPDGVSVRHQMVQGGDLRMELQQTQILNQPGTRPQDNYEIEAITVLDMNGGIGTYIWDKPYGRWSKPLTGGGNIQVTNLKARHRHYVIGETGSVWRPFGFGAPSWSFLPCWTHWPVAQLPSDGCVAAAPDRPSSSCCGTLLGVKHPQPDGAIVARNLYGMTDRPASWLVTLARSWNVPAGIKMGTAGFDCQGYDPNQRAYVMALQSANPPDQVEFVLAASAGSPLLNPAFVIKNWGDGDVQLSVDGLSVSRGQAFRVGHVATLQGTDLVVWIALESVKPVVIRMKKS